MDFALVARIAMAAVILLLLYSSGLPLGIVAITGGMIILFIFIRGPLYGKVEKFLEKRLPFTSKWHPWGRKIVVILIFILVLLVLKQVVYGTLKVFGMDVQGMMVEWLNQTGSPGGK